MARSEAAQPTRRSSRLNADYVREKDKDIVEQDHGDDSMDRTRFSTTELDWHTQEYFEERCYY